MKIPFLISAFIIPINFMSVAQAPYTPVEKTGAKTCFDEYYQAFVERGTIPVLDGMHDVIVSSRKDSITICVEGQINVKGGKIELPLMVKKIDGTYEPAKKQLHVRQGTGDNGPTGNLYSIIQGMSETFVTDDYYIANIFFVDCLKPAVKANAPAPSVNQIPGKTKVAVTEAEKEVIRKAYEGLAFKTGSAVILSSSYPTLNNMATMLIEKPLYNIEINGYTDNVGSAESNLVLSKKRAEATKNYLVKKGVNAERISDNGYGIENPIGDNKTPEGRAKNRRVEFVVVQ